MTSAHPFPDRAPGLGPGTEASRADQPSRAALAGEATEVDLLLRLARRWRGLGLQEAAEHGLTPHQERALLALARLTRRAERADGCSTEHPGVRVSHLADHLGIAPRSATEVADALVGEGLVSRSPDPTDRRAVLLRLTERGRRTVIRVRDRRRTAADAAVSTLSAADRAELRRLLETLLRS